MHGHTLHTHHCPNFSSQITKRLAFKPRTLLYLELSANLTMHEPIRSYRTNDMSRLSTLSMKCLDSVSVHSSAGVECSMKRIRSRPQPILTGDFLRTYPLTTVMTVIRFKTNRSQCCLAPIIIFGLFDKKMFSLFINQYVSAN